MTHELPKLALSIRQPWAWAIIHAGKDIENRSPHSVRHMFRNGSMYTGNIAIHAAKGMTQYEYDDARHTMHDIDVDCPPPAELARGGIIGTAYIDGVVREHESPWFFGPRGLILKNPRRVDFIPSVGSLGLFAWKRADPSIVPAPAKWMTGEARTARTKKSSDHPELF